LFWFTRLLPPTTKPVAVNDWMLSAWSAVSEPIGFERSPTMLDVRDTPSRPASSLTITKSGWKPTAIGRSSPLSPVYVPVATLIA
jgi:hypothetical protein